MSSRAIRLEKPINMNDVIAGEGFTFETNFDEVNLLDEESDDDNEFAPKLSTQHQLNNLDINDEDSYDCNQEPFEELEKLMVNVDDNGYVKKRIFRQGKGDGIPKTGEIKVHFHYRAYLEFEAFAYDSTYRRKKPHVCKLGKGEILTGLDIAISGMKINEKSQLIISSEMAYGELGCLPLIGPKTSILFEVELINFVEVIGEEETEEESMQSKCDFETNFNRSEILLKEANELIKRDKKYKPAILKYNDAYNYLSGALIKNETQSQQYVEILVRLKTNLAIAYNHIKNYKKCCITCNDAFKLCNTFQHTVPDKIYYNNAKALYGLNELKRAEEKLLVLARNIQFQNADHHVMELWRNIKEAKAQKYEAEKKMAKVMLKTATERNDLTDFKQTINNLCRDLLHNDTEKLALPDKLNMEEKAYVKRTVKEMNLKIISEETGEEGKKKYFIVKDDI